MALYLAPYSAKAPDYESENKEILRAIESVTGVIGKKGIWVADRGFDNRWLFNELGQRQLRFFLCAHRDRTVDADGAALCGSMGGGRRDRVLEATPAYGRCARTNVESD